MTFVRWILALALVVFFGFFGAQKFLHDPNPIFVIIAERSGIAIFEPQIRWVIGGVELLTALLLLIPRSRVYGAMLGLLVLIGAIGFHFSPWLGIDIPGVGTWVFYAACGGFVLSVIVFLLERGARVAASEYNY